MTSYLIHVYPLNEMSDIHAYTHIHDIDVYFHKVAYITIRIKSLQAVTVRIIFLSLMTHVMTIFS